MKKFSESLSTATGSHESHAGCRRFSRSATLRQTLVSYGTRVLWR
jgi:hypothetical protein